MEERENVADEYRSRRYSTSKRLRMFWVNVCTCEGSLPECSWETCQLRRIDLEYHPESKTERSSNEQIDDQINVDLFCFLAEEESTTKNLFFKDKLLTKFFIKTSLKNSILIYFLSQHHIMNPELMFLYVLFLIVWNSPWIF